MQTSDALTAAKPIIRAVRLEIVKPVGEAWDDVGPLLRTLAKATPKLLNAALDAKIAVAVAGRDAVKAAVAPDAKATSGDGLAYQAVLRGVESLRAWGEKKKHPFAALEIPGDMASAISRAACQAFARRDQQRPRFASERILVRAAAVSLVARGNEIVLRVKLRPAGSVAFVVAHSWGTHRNTLDEIVHGTMRHGDAKMQWDERRRKWYALLAYEAAPAETRAADSRRTLAVHRGIRNALFMVPSTGERASSLSGSKFMRQRHGLHMRTRELRRTSEEERGTGSKGHGRARRYEAYSALDDKIARVTHTFCQQAAALVAKTAQRMGCGEVVIEDYGGIQPNEDPALRRALDRFPLYQLKQAIASRLEKDGIALRETPSEYIASTCPRCGAQDTTAHNRRTGVFHCRACLFERPADWVAGYTMLKHSGADMSAWEKQLAEQMRFAQRARKEQTNDQGSGDDVRGSGAGVQAAPRGKRARRG